MHSTLLKRFLNSCSDNLKSKIGNRKWPWLAVIAFVLVACVGVAGAQQPTKIPRIGFVSGGGDSLHSRAFTSRHSGKGCEISVIIEGKNILVEYRYVEGKLDRIPSLVAELVQLKVDVLVCTSSSLIRAAKQATKTIPIVMVTGQDPVATGIVNSLARPGGNITGFTRLTRELSGKRLELLKEVIPGISRVGVLWDADAPGTAIGFKEYEAAARALKIQLQSLEVRDPNPDFEGAFQTAAKGRASALITISNTLLLSLPKADCGPCHKEPTAFNVRGQSVGRGRWSRVLFRQRC